MALGIAAVLGLWALVIVMRPLYGRGQPGAPELDAVPAPALAEREAAAKAALQDVEFDYQLGNLGEDDYQALRDRYTRRALAALKGRYDRERALDDAIEEQVRALLAKDASSNGHHEHPPSQAGAKRHKGTASTTGRAQSKKNGPSGTQRRNSGNNGNNGNGAHGRGRD